MSEPIKYQDLIATMFEGTPTPKEMAEQKVTTSQKKKLIQDIDRLDKKDHIGILQIIRNQTKGQKKKIYTINGYGCYFDLNDLDNSSINEIRYYVNLCLQNLERTQRKDDVYQEAMEHQRILEERFKDNKFKLGKIKPVSVSVSSEQDEQVRGQDDYEESISSDLGDNQEQSDSEEEDEDDMMMQGDLEDTTISDC